MRLTGKTALVTAAGQGIGRASVLAMAAQGAQVMATDLNPALLESYAEPLLNSHAEEWGHLSYRGTEPSELAHGPVVALLIDEVREAAEVEERKGAVHTLGRGDGSELGGVHGAPR